MELQVGDRFFVRAVHECGLEWGESFAGPFEVVARPSESIISVRACWPDGSFGEERHLARSWVDRSRVLRVSPVSFDGPAEPLRPRAQGPFGYPDQEPQEVEAEVRAREAPPAQHAKDPGKKFDGGKPRLWLIPGVVLLEIAKVLTFGADKYGADNWQLVKDSKARYGSALLRHFYAWQGGEERDPETGFYHLSHVGTNACFLIYHQVRGMFP